MWLFYVQHQFEHTVWDAQDDWSFHGSALHGSSYYDLPPILRWFSGNIGIHHEHHPSSRIPFYRLPEVLRANPQLATMGRLTLGQSVATMRLKLWDGGKRRLCSFSAAQSSQVVAFLISWERTHGSQTRVVPIIRGLYRNLKTTRRPGRLPALWKQSTAHSVIGYKSFREDWARY